LRRIDSPLGHLQFDLTVALQAAEAEAEAIAEAQDEPKGLSVADMQRRIQQATATG